jgi:DNA-binding IclR family transcriptional regulator
VARGDNQRPYSSAIAVERAADLLFLIAEKEEASLTELARAIGSSGSAVHRILTALKNKGLIQQDEENGPYMLSWSILGLTERLVARADLRTIARPHMIKLRDLTEETVTLNVRSGFERVCVDFVEGLHEVRWHQNVGQISPFYAGATGKALMAYLSDDELKEFFRTVKLRKITPYTLTKREDLLADLEKIRRQGYSIGTQDRVLGVAAMAAPIFNPPDRAAATLTIAGPSERCSPATLKEWAEPLTSAAKTISDQVGEASMGESGRDLTDPLAAGASGPL